MGTGDASDVVDVEGESWAGDSGGASDGDGCWVAAGLLDGSITSDRGSMEERSVDG